jgi:flagellar biosynthesis regulator FlbT
MLTILVNPGHKMLIDGVEIRFANRCSVTFPHMARFLAGRWVMEPDDAMTDHQRLYLALQNAYVGPREHRAAAEREAAEIAREIDLPTAYAAVSKAMAGHHHAALKILRQQIQREDPSHINAIDGRPQAVT